MTGKPDGVHPALAAWAAANGDAGAIRGVETLQEERKRSVYRLVGAGPDGSSLVAKRSSREAAARERLFYEDLLPRLEIAAPRCHAVVEGTDGAHSWIFLEDLGSDEPYASGDARHRDLAARWLGLLHVAGANESVDGLPDAGPARFAGDLARSIQLLRENAAVLSRVPGARPTTDALLRGCIVLANRWPEIGMFCELMPKTLVHGDFKEAHVFFRRTDAGPAPLVIDWAEAGRGVAALDVAKFLGYSVAPDLGAYLDVVRERWPFLDEDTIRRLAWTGEAFRCVRSLRWVLEQLSYAPPEGPLATMAVYRRWLEEIVAAEPWRAKPSAGPAARVPGPRTWY